MKIITQIQDQGVRRQFEHVINEFNRSNLTPVYGQESLTNPGSTGKVLVELQVSDPAGALMVMTFTARVSGGATTGLYGFTSDIGNAKTYVVAPNGEGCAVLHRTIRYPKGKHQFILTTVAAGNCTMLVDYSLVPHIATT